MKRLVKPIAKITMALILGGIVLSSCASNDDEVLDDISTELNDKTTDENSEKTD